MATTKGLESIESAFKRLESVITEEVKEIIEFTIGNIAMEAQRNAPGSGDMVELTKGSIAYDKITQKKGWISINQAIGYKMAPNGESGEVFIDESAGDIAAWIEFGTGQSAKSYLATVPEEWREIASRYYVNGKGRIVNKPFLLPAYNNGVKAYAKDIEAMLNKVKP